MQIQYKPLNVITFGQTRNDNINQMRTMTTIIFDFYLVTFGKQDLKSLNAVDNINQ